LLYRTDVIFGGDCLRLNFLSVENTLDEGIDGAKGVHLGKLLGLNETDLQLLEFLLDLRRHEHNSVRGIGA